MPKGGATPWGMGKNWMPPSKQNISKEKIELEIYNIFEQFKQEKNIKIVDYLNKFDVTLFKNREYRSMITLMNLSLGLFYLKD